MEKCKLCAFECNVDRINKKGVCNCGILPKIALVSKHMWEEPCISGKNGSGTIFFSGCNFSCMFCQNYKISQEEFGVEVSVERLAEIFIEQQEKGVNNINLVSPTPYVDCIIRALDIAKTRGFNIPVVYNTNGYDTVETIKKLNGYIDIYLPDLKYYDNDISIKYSKAPNYFKNATMAILEMYKQVGNPNYDKQGILKKGIIIRHLVLPGNVMQTKKILNWIKDNIPSEVPISIMAQYTPMYKACDDKIINRKLSKREYNIVLDLIENIENGYIQDLEDEEEKYVPKFDLEGVLKKGE